MEAGGNSKKRRQSREAPRLIVTHFPRDGRSFPGQPPRERYGKAYNYPYDELTIQQKAVARDVLGIIEASSWEKAMPRRLKGINESTVLLFQTKAWSQLNTDHQQLLTEYLHIDENFWNKKLAPFHDDLWRIPGITLTTKEFKPVLATIARMAQSQVLTKKDVAQFLFSIGKLLLPSQGLLIAETLKASSSWESLLESARGSGRPIQRQISHPSRGRLLSYLPRTIRGNWSSAAFTLLG